MTDTKRIEGLQRQLRQYQGNREMTRAIKALIRDALKANYA